MTSPCLLKKSKNISTEKPQTQMVPLASSRNSLERTPALQNIAEKHFPNYSEARKLESLLNLDAKVSLYETQSC